MVLIYKKCFTFIKKGLPSYKKGFLLVKKASYIHKKRQAAHKEALIYSSKTHPHRDIYNITTASN